MSAVRAVCFDLDGTLVETEALKARSYAAAVAQLRPELREDDVVPEYEMVVGRPREEVVAAYMQRFRLEAPAAARMAELGAATPAEAFAALRLRDYEAMLDDRALVRGQAYPHAIDLLRRVKSLGLRTGLATMSYAGQVGTVLEILQIRDLLDVVVTREEVARPKPDPEIYLLTAERLRMAPEECLVVEDSVPGVGAALAAGMRCVAVTTALTRASVHAAALLPASLVVDDPSRLAATVLPLLEGG